MAGRQDADLRAIERFKQHLVWRIMQELQAPIDEALLATGKILYTAIAAVGEAINTFNTRQAHD
jgi:hypothetical protein